MKRDSEQINGSGRGPVQEWLRAGREGDPRALEHLCRHFEPELAGYVRRQMGPRARRWIEPEDIVQNVLLECLSVRALIRLPQAADEGELLSRLLRTARSRIVDAVRGHGRDLGESVAAEGSPRAVHERSSVVTREDSRRWVRELVARLPERYGRVVQLCALEGLSYAEAGQRLGLEPDTVRKRYERARAALKSRLPNDFHV